jgi:hypothetical protein
VSCAADAEYFPLEPLANVFALRERILYEGSCAQLPPTPATLRAAPADGGEVLYCANLKRE